jgi:hypothetical protein
VLPHVLQQQIESLHRAFFLAFVTEGADISRQEAVRRYLSVKHRVARHTGHFGIVNNRLFAGRRELLVPYLVGATLVVSRIRHDGTETRVERDVPSGVICTDTLLKDLGSFSGDVVDLEPDIFGFEADQAEVIRISRVRDLGDLLQRVNETTNRTQAIYYLRFLVARLCNPAFEGLVGAKNLQPEVRNLLQQLVLLLNAPLARRIPVLVRLLVRNISGLVLKPSLIDRLWNDTIDLAELHVAGSDVANELRRSTHHALGKRTLLLARAYLEYLQAGETTGLAELGHVSVGAADERARGSKKARRVVARVVEDLEGLLGTSEVVSRIRDWQSDYDDALLRCEFGKSLLDETEEILRGIRERNRWVYFHHLRIVKAKGEDFSGPAAEKRAFLQGMTALLDVRPDDSSFAPDRATEAVRSLIDAFVQGIRQAYQGDLFPALESVLAAYGGQRFLETFQKIRELRETVSDLITRGGFTEQRYYLYQLDCLLEEMGYLCLAHVSTEYEERGLDLKRCLWIIRTSVLNLAYDGAHSRELVDLAAMLIDPRRTHDEVGNLLAYIQRDYHKIVQRITAPYERMQGRLGLDDEELRVVLGNMKRYMHDLNSMVHFCDLARSHILEHVPDPARPVDPSAPARHPGEEELEVLHLSHTDRIRSWMADGRESPGLRERFGGKGSGLAYISHLDVPTRDGFILPTAVAKAGLHEGDPHWLKAQLARHLRILEEDIAARDGSPKRYGQRERPLLLAVRGGSVFSMPGILPTVVFVGLNDDIASALAEDDAWHAYDSYRRFLATFARAVWGINIEAFDLVDDAKRRCGVKYKKDLPWEVMRDVAETSKAILRRKGYQRQLEAVLENPFKQLLDAVLAVISSWSRATPDRYRRIKGICHSWQTAVVVQEMASGNRQNREVRVGMDEAVASLTGVVPHTRITDLGVRALAGEIKFSAAGDDLVGGVTHPTSFRPIGTLGTLMPILHRRLRHTVAKLRRFQGTDQEIEFTVERGVLSVLQSRSAEFAAEQETAAFEDPGEEATRGIGIRGGAFRGLVAFDEADWRQLSEAELEPQGDVDGVLMVVENPTPDDIPLILQAAGLLTAKGGSSSHAAVAINGIERAYSAVMSAVGLRVDTRKHEAIITDESGRVRHRFARGDAVSIHGTTGEVYIGSRPLQVKNL